MHVVIKNKLQVTLHQRARVHLFIRQLVDLKWHLKLYFKINSNFKGLLITFLYEL